MDKKLLDYIKCVIELEQSIYTDKETVSQLREKQYTLAIPNQYAPPEDLQSIKNRLAGNKTSNWKLILIIGGILLVLAMLSGETIALILPLIFGLISIPCVILKDISRSKESSANAEREFAVQTNTYRQALEADHQRVEAEKQQIIEFEKQIQALEAKQADSQRLLDQYYSLNVIHPKYQNLPAICSIYEYLESGKCSSLIGPDGAYNKYDNDAHWREFYNKMDDTLYRLERIRESQFVLHQALQEGNWISQRILDNTTKQVYLGQQTAANTARAANEAKKTSDLLKNAEWKVKIQ